LPKLVLIGGPPGVGKTSVLSHLPRAFERCACLDADDVWRVHPFEVGGPARGIPDRNVTAVLRGYLEARYPFVFLAWVLARRRKIERILGGLGGLYGSALVLHLVASREALAERVRAKRGERGLVLEYALGKLAEIEALPFPKIDTTELAPQAVAEQIAALVRGGRPA
jgi:hypothetical protein